MWTQGLNESDAIGPGTSAPYAWDDLSLPHKLVVTVSGTKMFLLKETKEWIIVGYVSRNNFDASIRTVGSSVLASCDAQTVEPLVLP